MPDAPLFCLDEEYLICDLVINCVGENLVLCFFHAIVGKLSSVPGTCAYAHACADKKPLEDQSEAEKSEWSNWCGAPSSLSLVEYAADMYTALIPNSHFAGHHPQRVFQILRNEGRGIVFTWPLNGYEVLEFGGIARDVNLGGTGAVNEARTSCTRRYKANWRGQLSGMASEVESVYIPYGKPPTPCQGLVTHCPQVLLSSHVIVPNFQGSRWSRTTSCARQRTTTTHRTRRRTRKMVGTTPRRAPRPRAALGQVTRHRPMGRITVGTLGRHSQRRPVVGLAPPFLPLLP